MISSNLNDNIFDTQVFINLILGENQSVKALDKSLTKKVPVAVLGGYQLYHCTLLGTDVCLMFAKEEFSPAQIHKQTLLVQNALGMYAVAVLNDVKSYNIQRLTASKTNFIVPNKQMFLPSLMVVLKNPKSTDTDISETIPPIAQCIVLYHIQCQCVNGMTATKLTTTFSVSYATVNRAFRWLHKNGLAKLDGKKGKSLTFLFEGKDLWEHALPYLATPVEKTMKTSENIEGITCGIEALASLTMLAEPAYSCTAVTKDAAHDLGEFLSDDFGDNEVEIWRYNPSILSGKSWSVDPLSLYLSLRHNDDERIQIELDNLISTVKW